MADSLPGDIDVVILCGGLGSRLKTIVPDQPKPLAKIGDRPFLDILIDYIADAGFRRFILCSGYMGSEIRQYRRQKLNKSRNLKIVLSEEKEPLGTGGAIKKARSLIRSSPFWVMNGDSFCRVDLIEFLEFHRSNDALLTIGLTESRDENCGKVLIDENQKIIRFEEKARSVTGSYSSIGMYWMKQDIFSFMRHKVKSSLEHDLFPSLVEESCYAYVTDNELIDIGTPLNYKRAQRFFD